jgi:branched-chain amino acid transport system permease protein
MDFEYFFELFLGGLTRGSIYALIALGYTMVYGIIELINFAHGEIYMIGAFTGLIVAGLLTLLGWNTLAILVIASIVAVLYSCAYGWTMEKIAYKPLRKAPRLSALDQRHRHVAVPAKLRPARPDVRFSPLSQLDSGF